MKANQKVPGDIDEYISGFPSETREVLTKIRTVIRASAPEVEETISYHMPTFKFHGILVHFAAYKTHIGFYPTPSGIERYKKELSGYELSKGTVRFEFDKPIPYDLIQKITAFRARENLERMKRKRK